MRRLIEVIRARVMLKIYIRMGKMDCANRQVSGTQQPTHSINTLHLLRSIRYLLSILTLLLLFFSFFEL